jgi:hypothetical protein
MTCQRSAGTLKDLLKIFLKACPNLRIKVIGRAQDEDPGTDWLATRPRYGDLPTSAAPSSAGNFQQIATK